MKSKILLSLFVISGVVFAQGMSLAEALGNAFKNDASVTVSEVPIVESEDKKFEEDIVYNGFYMCDFTLSADSKVRGLFEIERNFSNGFYELRNISNVDSNSDLCNVGKSYFMSSRDIKDAGCYSIKYEGLLENADLLCNLDNGNKVFAKISRKISENKLMIIPILSYKNKSIIKLPNDMIGTLVEVDQSKCESLISEKLGHSLSVDFDRNKPDYKEIDTTLVEEKPEESLWQ